MIRVGRGVMLVVLWLTAVRVCRRLSITIRTGVRCRLVLILWIAQVLTWIRVYRVTRFRRRCGRLPGVTAVISRIGVCGIGI